MKTYLRTRLASLEETDSGASKASGQLSNESEKTWLTRLAASLTTPALLLSIAVAAFPGTASATTFVYEANNPRQASDDYPGHYNTYPGYLEYVNFQYNDVTSIFSMIATFKNDFAPTEGFRLTLNDGSAMPGVNEEAAMLFVHEDQDNPGTLAGSIYHHSPVTFREFRDRDLLAGKSEFDAISTSSISRKDGKVTFELSVDTSSVQDNFDGSVLQFDDTIGIWMPWFTNIIPSYDADGRLSTFYAPGTTHALGAGTRYSMLDSRSALRTTSFEPPTNTEVPEPTSMALMLSGLAAIRARKRRSA